MSYKPTTEEIINLMYGEQHMADPRKDVARVLGLAIDRLRKLESDNERWQKAVGMSLEEAERLAELEDGHE